MNRIGGRGQAEPVAGLHRNPHREGVARAGRHGLRVGCHGEEAAGLPGGPVDLERESPGDGSRAVLPSGDHAVAGGHRVGAGGLGELDGVSAARRLGGVDPGTDLTHGTELDGGGGGRGRHGGE